MPRGGEPAEPAPGEGRESREKICRPQERELEVLQGPVGLENGEEFYLII